MLQPAIISCRFIIIIDYVSTANKIKMVSIESIELLALTSTDVLEVYMVWARKFVRCENMYRYLADVPSFSDIVIQLQNST